MKATPCSLPEVLLIEPRVTGDARGFFLESYNRRDLKAATGLDPAFVQDNHSRSALNVLRGLHYQIRQPQGKLIRVLAGEIFDVAVDMRRSSPRFGHWTGMRIGALDRRMIWIPPGFAHGFLALTDGAEVAYKVTDYHAPEHERRVHWNDPDIGIAWPIEGVPVISDSDAQGVALRNAEAYP